MESFYAIVVQQWQEQSLFEVFAVILAIAYIWLAAEESIWCWPVAFVSSSLYAYLFWDVSLLFQLLLSIYYIVMAIVGFIHWHKTNDKGFVALHMSLKLHLIIIASGLVLTIMVSFLAKRYAQEWFGYNLLYLDAGITMFSLLATFLTVNKYLQSWMYWSIINFISIYLFIDNKLYLTVVLMVIYIVIAARGYINWAQNLRFADDIPIDLKG